MCPDRYHVNVTEDQEHGTVTDARLALAGSTETLHSRKFHTITEVLRVLAGSMETPAHSVTNVTL